MKRIARWAKGIVFKCIIRSVLSHSSLPWNYRYLYMHLSFLPKGGVLREGIVTWSRTTAAATTPLTLVTTIFFWLKRPALSAFFLF